MAGGRWKPEWSDVLGLLHMRLEDAAAELNVNIAYLRRLCRKHGLAQWPGKKIRSMQSIGRNVMLLEVRQGSPWAGFAAGPSSQLARTMATKEKDEQMIRIQEPVANPPAAGELATLNLIDKVGLSANNEREAN